VISKEGRFGSVAKGRRDARRRIKLTEAREIWPLIVDLDINPACSELEETNLGAQRAL
jgi:hypothetical protein